MSKSLKNFITIRQALQSYTPTQLRLSFLLSAWDKAVTFTDSFMDEV
jgi:cysteinyl-tRNA synthetase